MIIDVVRLQHLKHCATCLLRQGFNWHCTRRRRRNSWSPRVWSISRCAWDGGNSFQLDESNEKSMARSTKLPSCSGKTIGKTIETRPEKQDKLSSKAFKNNGKNSKCPSPNMAGFGWSRFPTGDKAGAGRTSRGWRQALCGQESRRLGRLFWGVQHSKGGKMRKNRITKHREGMVFGAFPFLKGDVFHDVDFGISRVLNIFFTCHPTPQRKRPYVGYLSKDW